MISGDEKMNRRNLCAICIIVFALINNSYAQSSKLDSLINSVRQNKIERWQYSSELRDIFFEYDDSSPDIRDSFLLTSAKRLFNLYLSEEDNNLYDFYKNSFQFIGFKFVKNIVGKVLSKGNATIKERVITLVGDVYKCEGLDYILQNLSIDSHRIKKLLIGRIRKSCSDFHEHPEIYPYLFNKSSDFFSKPIYSLEAILFMNSLDVSLSPTIAFNSIRFSPYIGYYSAGGWDSNWHEEGPHYGIEVDYVFAPHSASSFMLFLRYENLIANLENTVTQKRKTLNFNSFSVGPAGLFLRSSSFCLGFRTRIFQFILERDKKAALNSDTRHFEFGIFRPSIEFSLAWIF